MRNNTGQQLFKNTIIWLLGIVTVLYFVTGFGITQFRIVEGLTFGALSKALSFKIHNNLEIPFVVLLVLHISLQLILKRRQKRFLLNK